MLLLLLSLANAKNCTCDANCPMLEECYLSQCVQQTYPTCTFDSDCMKQESCKFNECLLAKGVMVRTVGVLRYPNGTIDINITVGYADGFKESVPYSYGGNYPGLQQHQNGASAILDMVPSFISLILLLV